ncbi:MAG TPA: cytochrome c-550 [Cyanobacteria bacterium UBA11149]|nr:cytochrome c-550 [Cyanobacteria bacterium UBA11367]HBE59419.1 cytochrome c-550 [Cyanobacteria bacterium UBA11366]HBR76558.1 cytochrome c-550 [Cyanobacteria bacterium UBA11159]HBS69409.1 cytochrome c-550 [Cyanobacteria bacterium UBA11153]HBW91701.1 cytochrome c-550 [Cyanobacteria bacterium UBA11149]HCA95538.1 cytochrome c-550 [Cyanobacteria bacterium UBA9226]
MKRLILLAVATLFFAFQLAVQNVAAIELDEATRTLKLNGAGDTVVFTLEQIKEGKRIFNDTCAQCHAQGETKTDPNVDLGGEALAYAFPPRDNIEAIVEFLKDPMSYDGAYSISDFHPSLKSADIFPEMRNLSEDDLYAVAGHILLQPKVQGIQWGGGKAVR